MLTKTKIAVNKKRLNIFCRQYIKFNPYKNKCNKYTIKLLQ